MAKIRIYGDVTKGCVLFEGSRIDPKFLGTVQASVKSDEDRIVVVRTDKTNSEGEFRELFRRLKPNRVQDRDGVELVGDLGYTTAQVAEYINAQAGLILSSGTTFDLHVDGGYTGTESTGTSEQPFKEIDLAILAASPGFSIEVRGVNIINETLDITSSIKLIGAPGAEIRYGSYADDNGDIVNVNGSSTQEYVFKNIKFSNASGYGIKVSDGARVVVEDCEFVNNGWDGTQLDTILDSSTSSLLGFDSTASELQAFYAGDHASNGGAMRIESVTNVEIVGNTVANNLRGIRLQDCGIGGAGFVTRNISTKNIESGIYLAASTEGGCQNITVTMNYSSFNANNGLLCVGGINNKFSQNEVNGNWNAGLCAWGSANTTLRDSALYNNNRSALNGIGNTGDAKSSIQVNDTSSFLATQLTLNPDFRYIIEVLGTQVHYTGLGSNTDKIGFLITSAVGSMPDSDKNIIRVDDVGFIGQDYAIDLSEVDTTNLRVSVSDNSFQSIGELAVRKPAAGKYFEVPFSNQITRINYADFSVDNTGTVVIKEGVNGASLNPYSVNELAAVANGTEISIILKDSDKVQFNVPVSGCSIEGSAVNSVLANALVQLNNLLTNTGGFGSGSSSGNPVTNFVLNNDDLTLTLQDGTSFTVDVSTLGVADDKFVQSGALVGSNLELTMTDSSVVSIDASNMINGSTLPARAEDFYIAYGNSAGDVVTSASVVNLIANKQPFYNGDTLEKGEEFVWTHEAGGDYVLGVYSGAEETTDDTDIFFNNKWTANYKFLTSGADSEVAETSVGVDVASRYASGYAISNSTVFALRYGNDNHLYLLDVSGDGETVVGKTNVALVGDEVTIFFGGQNQPNAKFPVMVKRFERWTIVHDLDESENGEWQDGVEESTVIKSNLSMSPGQKILLNLNYFGRNERIGLGYSGASTGNSSAEDQLTFPLLYNSAELIKGAINDDATGGDWTWNQSAGGYFDPDSDGEGVGYQSTDSLEMISFRYLSDNSVELWSEYNNERIATLATTLDGSPTSVYLAFNEAHPSQRIPSISKQDLGQGSQPVTAFAPDISDQTIDITEGEVFNVAIALDAGSDIVNQYGETDAPSWAVLNQSTGNFSGTAPEYNGSTDSYVINCKAANVLGGSTSFTVTLNVLEETYVNTKSLRFADGVNSYLGGNAALVTSLERSGNGSGSSDAWTVAFWFKASTANNGQTLFYFGASDTTNGGHVEIKQTNNNGQKRLRVRYGSNANHLQFTTPSASIDPTQWQHVLVSYDGGTTGASSASVSSYYSRFKIFIDGVQQSTSNTHSNYGWSGAIVGQNYRFGRLSSGNYPKGVLLNQLAIWNSDQSSNVAGLYNSGKTQDISTLASGVGQMNTAYLSVEHYYEIEDSTSTVVDLAGTAHFIGYNFSSSDLVTDAPPTV